MNLYYTFFILLIFAVVFFLIWKFVPQPPKIALLWIVGIALTVWLLTLVGFFAWMKTVNV